MRITRVADIQVTCFFAFLLHITVNFRGTMQITFLNILKKYFNFFKPLTVLAFINKFGQNLSINNDAVLDMNRCKRPK